MSNDEMSFTRCNAKYLNMHQGQGVRIIGVFLGYERNSLKIRTTDDQTLTISTAKEDPRLTVNSWIEVQCINSPNGLIEQKSYPIPVKQEAPIDPEVWNNLVECIHKYQNIF